jgi:hypothetical protein
MNCYGAIHELIRKTQISHAMETLPIHAVLEVPHVANLGL